MLLLGLSGCLGDDLVADGGGEGTAGESSTGLGSGLSSSDGSSGMQGGLDSTAGSSSTAATASGSGGSDATSDETTVSTSGDSDSSTTSDSDATSDSGSTSDSATATSSESTSSPGSGSDSGSTSDPGSSTDSGVATDTDSTTTTDSGSDTEGNADGGLDLAGPPACPGSGVWLVETIAFGSATAIDIAVGASGTPQVVWLSDASGGYAVRGSGPAWVEEPGFMAAGQAVGIAANPIGVGADAELPFVALYPVNTVAGLWSRQRDAEGNWFGVQLDNTMAPNDGEVDIAYASDGTLFAAYSIFTGQLVHASLAPDDAPGVAAWNDELVDATLFFTADTSIAVDGDTIHIAYAGGTDLRYARRIGSGAFALQTVDDEHPSRWPAIAFDPGSGVPVISYHDDGSGALRYALEDPTWTHELVDGGVGTLGRNSGLGVASDGRVALAYWDFTGLDVEAAERADFTAGAWSLETVDFADTVGAWTSAAMDDFGGLHVAYLKAAPSPAEMRYAYLCP